MAHGDAKNLGYYVRSKTVQGLNPVLKLIIPEHLVGVEEWPSRSTTYVNDCR
jgi:hypothetical protein